uniref:Translation initiation factor IF-2 n=1 Tax=Steinernema glaseri TaxID=37863 RepID=A0A1I7YD15_9BILA
MFRREDMKPRAAPAPAPETKADGDFSWRSAKPRAPPAAAPAPTAAPQAPQPSEADSGDWKTVGPRQAGEAPARKPYRPPGSVDRKPGEKKAYVPPGAGRPPPVNAAPLRRAAPPGGSNATVDDDSNWRRKK